MDISLRLAHPFMPFVTEVGCFKNKNKIFMFSLKLGTMATYEIKITNTSAKGISINHGRRISNPRSI